MNTFQQVYALQTKVEEQVAKKQLTTATETQLDVLKLAQPLKKPKLMAILYQRLGQILEQRGVLQKTVYAYEAAFKALMEEDHQLELTSRRLRQARKSFNQNRKISVPDVFSPAVVNSLEEALKAKDLNVKLLINIGNSYLAQPQINPALNAYQQVLQQENIHDFPLLKAQTLIKIGEIQRQQQKLDLAHQNVATALKLFAQHGMEKDCRFAYALQARLQFQAQKVDEAIPNYQKAIAIFEEMKDYQNGGKVLAQLGQLYLGINKFSLAKDSYLKALKCLEHTSEADGEWHLFWGLGCCAWEVKDWSSAAEYFEKSRHQILKRQNKLYTDEGKVAFLESTQDVFDRLIECYLNLGTSETLQKAFEVVETAKGQSLTDLMQGRNRRRATSKKSDIFDVDINFMSNVPPPMEQMSINMPIVPSKPEDTDDSDFDQIIDALQDEQDQAMIRQEAIGFQASNAIPEFSSIPISEMAEVEQELEVRPVSKRCFLSFYLLADRLLVWLKTASGDLKLHQWVIDRTDLAKKVQAFRKVMIVDAESRGIEIFRGVVEKVASAQETRSVVSRITRDTNIDLSDASQELYTHLIQPFQDNLKEEDSTLVIVPHDFLWLLPFAALKDKTGKYLGTKQTLLYSPSIKTLHQIDKEAPYSAVQNAKALIVGNPKMSQAHEDYTFNQLKGAEKEAIAVGKLFDTAPLLHELATQKAIEKDKTVANILHFATHGMADEINPLDSFIVLADQLKTDGTIEIDGLLKAREVMHWSLPCELVNLSACQTALGKVSGEGMIGLSRAFLVAGSRSVLVSLWNISDEATAAFMIEFYKNYLALNNKGLALQKTIAYFQEGSTYEHAVFWAGFTLVGSDN